MATKIVEGGGPSFRTDPAETMRSDLAAHALSLNTNSVAMKKFANPVDQIHLDEAFAAAARVDEALERAVSRKFENDGAYQDTNIFDLSFGKYMGVVMFAVLTAGAGAVIYSRLSTEKNAARDDYKRRVEKHFEVMNSRLRDAVKKIPASEQKSLLQEFARKADFSFRMEKAVLAATASDTFNQGLALVRSAESLTDDKPEPSYAEAYLARTFPKAGFFENKLKGDLAQLKMQLL